MTDQLYDVSNRLFRLRRDFLPHEIGGVSLSENDVRLLNVLLFDLGREVLAQAHHVSGYQWPNSRQMDLPNNTHLLDELMRPETNLVLFGLPEVRREKA